MDNLWPGYLTPSSDTLSKKVPKEKKLNSPAIANSYFYDFSSGQIKVIFVVEIAGIHVLMTLRYLRKNCF